MATEHGKLTYTRQTLIDSLNEELGRREQQREAAAQAQAEKNAEQLARITSALAVPEFLDWVVNQVAYNWGGSAKADDLADYLRNYYGQPTSDRDPDEGIKRMIRVYDKAEDEQVEVAVTDEVYRYL